MRVSAFLLFVFFAVHVQAQYTISTVAGGGPPDGARATDVATPPGFSLATDAAGNVYVPAPQLHRVFKITPDGRISTFAGLGGGARYGGDGGPAISAQLNNPYSVASDRVGNVYIADTSNYRIRKVSPAGIITTVAGTSIPGSGGDGGPATSATLTGPQGVAVDPAGNLYIADTLAHRVRKVTAAGVITTLAGTGVSGYSGDGGPAVAAALNLPVGVVADNSGNVYIADWANNRVRKVTTAGLITTIAGNGSEGFGGDGGPATLAALARPTSVATDSSGNLLIADYLNNRLRQVDASGSIMTIAGNGICTDTGDEGLAAAAQVCAPAGLGIDSEGNIYLGGSYPAGRIRRISPARTITTFAGNGHIAYSGEGGPALTAQVSLPYGVAVDGAGVLYIAAFADGRVLRVLPSGVISTVATLSVSAIVLDGSGNLYMAGHARIYKLTPSGTTTPIAGTGVEGYGGDDGPATAAQLSGASAVAVDAAGNVYIADTFNHRVRKVTASGVITTIAGSGAPGFSGDGRAATSAQLTTPVGVAVDLLGNLYIADTNNHRIRKVTPSGTISTVTGSNGELMFPSGVAVDAAGNLFIADTYNSRIRRLSPDGTITTIAGTSTAGYSGDGGAATSAQLNNPTGLTVDSAGNVFIADSYNHRIRKLTPMTAGCTPQVSPSAVTVPGGAGSSSIGLTIPAGCSWTATTATPWLTITFGASGTGNGTVIFQIAANATGAVRTGKLTIAGIEVPITQTALSACAFSLTAPPGRIPATGQTGTLTLTTTGCPWTASSDQTWAQVGPPLSGNNSATLSYRVFPNLSTTVRFAHFTIGGQTYTIAQEGNTETAMSRFVRLLYFGFLGRNPSQAEIAAQVNSGLNRETLAQNFFNSAEFKAGGRFVAALYIAMLRRDAEYGGWQFQRLALADSGGGQVALAQAYITTPEFVMRYGELTDAAFIREMYVNILGRTPSQAEIDWQLPNVRKTNGRGAFVTAMVQVPEFDAANQRRLQAFLLYSTLLMREARSAELDLLIGELQTPGGLAQTIVQLVNSPDMNALIE